MGFLSFLSKLLGLGRRFSGTPEQYLAMVRYIAAKNNPAYTQDKLLHWGETFQKIMNVKLAHYADFRDLMAKGTPDVSLITKVDERYEELETPAGPQESALRGKCRSRRGRYHDQPG
ncbi:hypothetical protein AAFN85_03245 [Mucilaginibacter sp. CAU 1740]|uniref:hypothetical protein n=1 Tax=Mucilaginibacter sp. CAU 1740 TaxID=3140365 RepID=UPI00325BEBDA